MLPHIDLARVSDEALETFLTALSDFQTLLQAELDERRRRRALTHPKDWVQDIKASLGR